MLVLWQRIEAPLIRGQKMAGEGAQWLAKRNVSDLKFHLLTKSAKKRQLKNHFPIIFIMESGNERILSFIAEWFDPQPQIIKRYLLKYHCSTNEVEMRDIQTKRSFLKKTKIPPTLKESDFYLEAKILLLARDLRLTEYADSITRQLLESEDELTVCVLLPALYESLGEVVSMIETTGGFTLVNMKSICLRRGDKDLEEAATKLLNVDRSDIVQPEPMVAMSFRGSNSIAAVNALIQTSTFSGLLAFPDNATEAAVYHNFFFMERRLDTTATFEECTCCVIKPHAVKERLVGSIIHDIHSRGFLLSAVAMFRLERSSAAEFLEVYGGVFPEYNEMVDEMCSGSVVALEVRLKPQLLSSTCDDNDHSPPIGAVEKFRAHAGPWDVTMGEWSSIVIVC